MALRLVDRAYPLAEGQGGFLTSRDLIHAGFNHRSVARAVGRGDFERLDRGIFRIAHFPYSGRESLWEAVLWPEGGGSGVRGVISHDTALWLLGLSDLNPSKTHITVPVRVRRKLPENLVVHKVQLEPTEVTLVDELPVTTIPRTLQDLHRDGIGQDILKQALAQARARGIIVELP